MVFVRERATLFFQKQNFNKKKYIYLSFFNAKFLQLQLNVQKLQLQQSFVAVSTCFTVTLQTVVNIAEGPLHDIRQHGLYFEEVFFFSTKHTVSVEAELFTMFQLHKVRHGAHHLGLALYQPLQLIDSFL